MVFLILLKNLKKLMSFYKDNLVLYPLFITIQIKTNTE